GQGDRPAPPPRAAQHPSLAAVRAPRLPGLRAFLRRQRLPGAPRRRPGRLVAAASVRAGTAVSRAPLLVSLHLPKTAGTSFSDTLRAAHGAGYRDDYADLPMQHGAWTRRRHALRA